jgi:hypothetical protein
VTCEAPRTEQAPRPANSPRSHSPAQPR